MAKKIGRKEQEAIDKFHELMVKKIKKGKSKAQIVEELVADGYTRREAQTKVNEGWKFVMDLVEGERFTANAILPAIFGGILGACIGGAIWSLIVFLTNYESSYLATGVGLVVGFCITLFTKGRRGWPVIIIAFIFSLVGIMIAKYYTFYHFMKRDFLSFYGEDAEFKVSLFSQKAYENFIDKVDQTLDGASGVWIFFALVAAWKMTSSLGIKVKKKK